MHLLLNGSKLVHDKFFLLLEKFVVNSVLA